MGGEGLIVKFYISFKVLHFRGVVCWNCFITSMYSAPAANICE